MFFLAYNYNSYVIPSTFPLYPQSQLQCHRATHTHTQKLKKKQITKTTAAALRYSCSFSPHHVVLFIMFLPCFMHDITTQSIALWWNWPWIGLEHACLWQSVYLAQGRGYDSYWKEAREWVYYVHVQEHLVSPKIRYYPTQGSLFQKHG